MSSVWGGFSTTLGNIIKRLENAAARAITGNYDFIYLLSACEPMEVIIQRRFVNFANSIHNNEVLSTIANVAKNNYFSTFGYNYANSITNHINEWYSNIIPDEILYIDTVRELIEVRDGRQVIAGLDKTELL